MTSCFRTPRSYLDRGNRLFDEGKYDDAALNYRKALQKDSRYGEGFVALGKAQLKQDKVFEAYQSFSRAVQLLPNSDDAKIQLGDVAVSIVVQDRSHPKYLYNQVSVLRDSFLVKDPNSFDGQRWKGYLAIVDRKPQEAVECFTKAHKLKPDDPKVATMLAEALFQAGSSAEGERLAFDQLAKDKSVGELYDALYWHFRGSKRLADAESILKKKVANFPGDAACVFQLVTHYQEIDNLSEMKRLLEQFAQYKSQTPPAMLQVGDFYARLGMYSDAIRTFEEGVRADAKNSLLYRKRLANAYLGAGRTTDAQLLVNQLYQASPHDRDTLAVRASLMSKSGNSADLDRSIEEFRSLVKEDPKDAILRFGLAHALIKRGDSSEARKELQAVVSIDGRLLPARYELAEIALGQNDSAELLRQAQELIRRAPGSVRANRLYALGLVATGSTYLARSAYQGILRRDPTDVESILQLASLEINSRHFKEAETLLKSAEAGKSPSPNARIMGLWAQLYSAQGKPQEAIALLSDAARKYSNSRDVRVVLARTAYRLKKPEIAIEQYTYLLTQIKAPELYYELGRAQESKGDNAGALASYQQMQRLAPRDGRADFGMGRACENLGQTAQALAHYKNAIQLNTDDPQLYVNLATLLAELGTDLDHAVDLSRKAEARLPNSPAIADTLAYAYLKKNMIGSALPVFRGLVKKFPNEAIYHYHLALALLQGGDKQGARKELQECVKRPQPEQQAARANALLASVK